MSASKPWWFSGDESASNTFDLGSLATGAQHIIEWARDSLLTTHQSHVNPDDHPTCLLCKAMQLFQQTSPVVPASDEEAVVWIDLDSPR